ncbi:hypothetical protein [Hyphomicrobium sp.]|jgi:hypothetical protein|uniref:hypothetical protein n=1 Tax=Hyphomicrobium sp. TaxID=82 RepID=UPI003562ADEB
MIESLTITYDPAGFPIVRWVEKRGAHSPEAFGEARVECRIKRDGDRKLYFVATGTKRRGGYVEAKPFQSLAGFKQDLAERLFKSQAELALMQRLKSKMKLAGDLLDDGARVILADFLGDHPIYINCAEASPVEINHLVLELDKAFAKARKLADDNCDHQYCWPLNKGEVEDFVPPESSHVQHNALPTAFADGFMVLVIIAGGIWLFHYLGLF